MLDDRRRFPAAPQRAANLDHALRDVTARSGLQVLLLHEVLPVCGDPVKVNGALFIVLFDDVERFERVGHADIEQFDEFLLLLGHPGAARLLCATRDEDPTRGYVKENENKALSQARFRPNSL